MVSLKDVARELDLSVGLVSKVLNSRMGTTGVSAEKRERIIALAKAKGFVPNRVAQALRSGRVGTIGVFLHPMGEPGTEISETILRGMAEGLANSPFHLWLTFFEYDSDFHRTLEGDDIRRQADALIVAGVPHPDLMARFVELDRNYLPVVMHGEDEAGPLTQVSVDNHLQGFLPTKHLIAQGCRRIAHVCTTRIRQQGYLDAMRSANLPTDGLILSAEKFNAQEGRVAVRKLIEGNVPFDGLVCQSDHQAFGAIQELMARGIRVPEQVRVTGVDDSPLCDLSPVPLTSVTAEGRALGRGLVSATLQRFENKQASSLLIQPRLIQRASS